MKKVLFIIPLALIALNVLPVSIYKDVINYGSSLDTLSPSHWKLIDMQISASANLSEATVVEDNYTPPKPDAISKDATFRGFPAGAYFSKSSNSDQSGSSSSFSASAYSWLWAALDVILILVALGASLKINRKNKTPEGQANSQTPVTPSTPQPAPIGPTVTTPAQPSLNPTAPSISDEHTGSSNQQT